ncbi:DUF502 domain-containing protein [Aquincola tertiaricarbonis]|uniref:DUF502 domain-containing protein n=1 Tax=Aquincola tertiaricarbonis TaxID=391953 RepID=UPI0009FA8C2D|nr:DUF502 domain-containing protein [Aquincola tertiaricarbonis]
MKKYLLAGLLVWLPMAVTVWVLHAVLGLMDGVFGWILSTTQAVLPTGLHGPIETLRDIPFLGLFVVVVLLLLTGVFATNFAGQWALRQGSRVLHRIPIVKSIYSSVKQVSDTLFSSNGNAFREAVLVQYPRAGAWTIAFITGRPGGEVAARLSGEHVSLYVPTTPNPTSGFFLMVPRSEVIALRMSVDEALKYIISMGVVAPPLSASALPVVPPVPPVPPVAVLSSTPAEPPAPEVERNLAG